MRTSGQFYNNVCACVGVRVCACACACVLVCVCVCGVFVQDGICHVVSLGSLVAPCTWKDAGETPPASQGLCVCVCVCVCVYQLGVLREALQAREWSKQPHEDDDLERL